MGSFFERPERLLREMHRVLRPGGKGVLSFYNIRSLVHQLPLPENWQASLAAIVDERAEHGLIVTFGHEKFDISARAYSVAQVLKFCKSHFRDSTAVTFPAISAALPQIVSGHPRAIEVCDEIDRALAVAPDLQAGAYIIATVIKGGGIGPIRRPELRGYARLLTMLEAHDMHPEVKEHAPVQTMADVFSFINAPRERMLKSVLVRVRGEDDEEPRFVLCVVASTTRVSLRKVAKELGVPRRALELATQDEIETVTGFTVGALSPIGMPNDVPVVLDAKIHESGRDDDIWCGSGKRTESFKMSLNDLERVVGPSVREISDPDLNTSDSRYPLV